VLCRTGIPNYNFLRQSVHELRSSMGQTDGRSDRQTDDSTIFIAASLVGWRFGVIIIQTLAEIKRQLTDRAGS